MTTVDDRWVDLGEVLEEMRAEGPLNHRLPFSPEPDRERPRDPWETCDIPVLPRLVEPAPMTDPALRDREEQP